MQHPKILPILNGVRYPLTSVSAITSQNGLVDSLGDPSWPPVINEDRLLTLAVIGLGPVGVVSSTKELLPVK